MNILIVEVSQNVAVIVHLFPSVPKYGNVFIKFFKLVSNISVDEHAWKNSSFICLGIALDYYCLPFETVHFGDCSAL
jgi:hypothetical protein